MAKPSPLSSVDAMKALLDGNGDESGRLRA
jgi:hypothetical protein